MIEICFVFRTLNYVRKCCKYSETNDNNDEELLDSTILFHKGHSTKINRSHSLAPIVPAVKQPQSPIPFRMNTKGSSQSAHVSSRSRSLATDQHAKSANGIRSINSAPARTTSYYRKEPRKSQRPPSRIFASKHSLQQFRRYPERFLSQSNRYLPLLRRQAVEIELKSKKQAIQSVARLSDGSELTFDDIGSFLSEENEAEFVDSF